MDFLVLLQPGLTHWFNLHASVVQKDFMIFCTKFLRPFVFGTDGVNCSAAKSPAVVKHQIRQEFLCWAFINHKTAGC